MDNGFHCLDCGAEFSQAEAEQVNCQCPNCEGKLAEKVCEDPGVEKKGMGIAVFAVIFIMLFLIGGIYFGGSPADDVGGKADGRSQMQAIDTILQKALEINPKTPLMIDKSTRLDQVVVEGQTITYRTTLVNFTAEIAKDDLAKRDLFKKEIGPFLAGKYCSDKNSRKALELGVKYGHEYFGNDGALLYTANISVDDC